MKVLIHQDYSRMSEAAAEIVAARITAHNAKGEKRPFVLGLPTGSTPIGMYQKLVEWHQAGKISFQNVVTFNMDEYVGLAPDHPESYHHFMWYHFFSHIDIPKEQVHILDGLAKDPDAECEAYERKIESFGGIDLFIGGIGSDGHIAFNEPGSSLTSRTRVKRLSHETIRDNARFFHDNRAEVPSYALTVGVKTVMDAREVMILINGAKKARALQQMVEGGVNHLYTASALQMHPQGIIVCDEEAVEELKVSTYRYFKGLTPDLL